MKCFFAGMLITALAVLNLQAQNVKGWVIDKESNDPLPFATVAIKGSTNGTITNEEGYFEMRTGDARTQLFVSYMGYQSRTVEVTDKAVTIELQPAILTLEELVIKPLSPEEYIKQIVKNQVNALPRQPYTTKAYYREKFKENDGYIAYNEGMFKFHFPTYQDSLNNQYQLYLFETAANPQEIQFLKKKRDKKEARQQRKAKKKGETYETEDPNDFVQVNFGGPKQILDSQMGKGIDSYLDSTYFNKYRYEFGAPMSYQNRELMVINFKSKGKVDNLKASGKIYIDTKLDALAGVEYDGKMVIPFVIKPILLAFGITISNPNIQTVSRMQYIDGHWYPDYNRADVHFAMKKSYLFSENEISNIDIDQVLKITDLQIGHDQEIPEEKRFDADNDPQDQVFNDENWEWEDFNTIIEEEGK